MIRPPPRSTRTDTLFPYTTLFRSAATLPAAFLSHSWDNEGVATIPATIGPALGHGLDPRPELQPLGAILVGVAKGAALPPAEAVVGDRHRDRHIDPDHADIDAAGKLARGMAVAREDRDTVAILVLAEIGRASCRERVCQYV